MNKDSLWLYSSFYTLSNKQFAVSDKYGKTLRRFLDIPKTQGSLISYNIFSKQKDVNLYALPYDNHVYTFENGNPKILFSVDLNDRFLKIEHRELPFQKINEMVLDSGGKIITEIQNLTLLGNSLYFTYNYKHFNRSAIVDYTSGKLLASGYLAGSIENPFISSKPVGATENQLVFSIFP